MHDKPPREPHPADLLGALPPDCAPHLLDARGPGGWGSAIGAVTGRRTLFGLRPEIEFHGGAGALAEAERWLAGFRGGAPLDAVLIGSLSYELGREFAPGALGPAPGSEPPTVALSGFRALYCRDEESGRGAIAGSSARARRALREELLALPARVDAPALPTGLAATERTPEPAYLSSVRRVQGYIREGDVYQVNLSRRLEAPAPDTRALRTLYRRLAEATRAPFCAYLECADRTILSSSPERFLRSEGARVETCPIKGTRPRGRSPAEDAALGAELAASAKDRAEHVMIVDLERNDLGRVCEIGSVCVPQLAALQSFSDVHHLVSAVRGRLREPADWVGLLQATFPGGSITGAPKLRAMQIIAELEPVPRGVYTGAIGCIDAAGGVDLSIAIRTAVASRGELQLALGGGIVADSAPADELRETRDKGRAFARSWGLAV